MAFSPDGAILTTITRQNSARLWNVATRGPVSTLGQLGGVNAVAFSPDSATLATAQNDGTARLWDIATGQQVGASMVASLTDVEAVTFSRDGTMLATGGDDGTARLWDVATQHEIGPTMQAGTTVFGVQDLAFGDDDATLGALGGDGASLWDVAFPRDLLGAVCSIAARPLSEQEWNSYIKSASYVRACP